MQNYALTTANATLWYSKMLQMEYLGGLQMASTRASQIPAMLMPPWSPPSCYIHNLAPSLTPCNNDFKLYPIKTLMRTSLHAFWWVLANRAPLLMRLNTSELLYPSRYLYMLDIPYDRWLRVSGRIAWSYEIELLRPGTISFPYVVQKRVITRSLFNWSYWLSSSDRWVVTFYRRGEEDDHEEATARNFESQHKVKAARTSFKRAINGLDALSNVQTRHHRGTQEEFACSFEQPRCVSPSQTSTISVYED